MRRWPAALPRFDGRLYPGRRVVVPAAGWSSPAALETAPGESWVICVWHRPRRTVRAREPVHELLCIELTDDPREASGEVIMPTSCIYQAGATALLYRAAHTAGHIALGADGHLTIRLEFTSPAIDREGRGALRIDGALPIDGVLTIAG